MIIGPRGERGLLLFSLSVDLRITAAGAADVEAIKELPCGTDFLSVLQGRPQLRWIERQPPELKAAGSNPSGRTKVLKEAEFPLERPVLSIVGFAAVANGRDIDNPTLIVDLIENAVVPDSDAPPLRAATKFLDARRPRFMSKRFELRVDTRGDRLRQLFDFV